MTASKPLRELTENWKEARRRWFQASIELLSVKRPQEKPLYLFSRAQGVSVKLVREVLAGRR